MLDINEHISEFKNSLFGSIRSWWLKESPGAIWSIRGCEQPCRYATCGSCVGCVQLTCCLKFPARPFKPEDQGRSAPGSCWENQGGSADSDSWWSYCLSFWIGLQATSRKKVIPVIPAIPSKRLVTGTRMQDAAATLSRNKLLKIVSMDWLL